MRVKTHQISYFLALCEEQSFTRAARRCGVAQPSLTQLALRLALATPFWKSGILKWSGFLQLNDTAIYLFANEFKLHLPGGPYDFPAPAAMALTPLVTISSGRLVGLKVPSPSWPPLLSPMAQRLPSDLRKRL